MAICKGDSLFGDRGKYIKFLNGDIVAVDGMNIFERLLTNDLRMPYKQLLKSRVILKPYQVDYLLNHLGMGDNATFLAIRARYNQKSVNEEDNYVVWNYFDDFSKKYAMGQVMILTGNSTNRIKQLYLTNPNDKYSVELDIMVASIDDEYNFFPEVTSQFGITYLNMSIERFRTHITGTSFVINDSNNEPLIFIQIDNIRTVERSGKIVTINDTVIGYIILVHNSDNDAAQTHSMLNYLINNPNIVIEDIGLDLSPPVIYFNDFVGGVGATISVIGTSSTPVDSSMGVTFSTEMVLSLYDNGIITKDIIISELIDGVIDNRDGVILLSDDNLVINSNNLQYYFISSTGSYTVELKTKDIALNETLVYLELFIL